MNSMLGFADWIKRNTPCDLSERALNIGNRSVAYPRFDNVLIIAGGAGSVKDFVLNNMIKFTVKEVTVYELRLPFCYVCGIITVLRERVVSPTSQFNKY